MDFLVVSPPVCTPAEPPSGAFMLAAALAGHGFETGLLDLSLEFYHRILEERGRSSVSLDSSISYLTNAAGYDQARHRTAAGQIHRHLKDFGERWPGWRLTLMDCVPPWHLHDIGAGVRPGADGEGPFAQLWEDVLSPVLSSRRPVKVVVSLAYLSQLPAVIDIVAFLRSEGVDHVVGGSLLRSLAATGEGIGILERALGPVDLSDGSTLLGMSQAEPFLDRLGWPVIISSRPYLSARPVIPLALSTGCHWRRCLFCPDRHMPFVPVDTRAIDTFFDTVPGEVMSRGPVVHLLDSAMPPRLLRAFAPVARDRKISYYGFARPSDGLLRDGLMEELADSGCAMLQLGVEGGSGELLDRFDKGLDPVQSARVIDAAADAGIRTYLYLLFGLPTETEADREATTALLETRCDRIDFLNLSLFNLPRHTELAQRSDEFGMEVGEYSGGEGVLRLYSPFTCGGESTREQARRFIDGRLLRVPQIRRAHLRTPRWFRAAHMAMMNVEGRRPLPVVGLSSLRKPT